MSLQKFSDGYANFALNRTQEQRGKITEPYISLKCPLPRSFTERILWLYRYVTIYLSVTILSVCRYLSLRTDRVGFVLVASIQSLFSSHTITVIATKKFSTLL